MPTYLSPGVYVEETQAGSAPIEGAGTAVAAFVGFAERGPFNTPTLVSNWTQFVQAFGDFLEGGYLAQSVYGYFSNGGGNCYIVRVGQNGNGKAELAGPVMHAQLPAATGSATAMRITAKDDVEDPGSLTVEVADSAADKAPDGAFRIIVRRGEEIVEDHDPVTPPGVGRTSVTNVLSRRSNLVQVADSAEGEMAVPARGTVTLTEAPAEAPVPEEVKPDQYIGDTASRTGFGGLEAVDSVTMLAVPDALAAHEQGLIDDDGLKAIQLGMIAHCESMGDRVAIIDTPGDMTAQEVRDWRLNTAGYDSKYAAMYWPWIKVFDPASGENIHMPPSGHVAGVWGRNDDTRGVHKAPANEVIRGALEPQLVITSTEQELLNPEGINVIRSFPGRGVRIWGARTLSSDPAWRYLNVRRLFNYIEESILGGTQWAVFEPNDHNLWAKMRRTIAAFLVNEWRKGALFGQTPDQAFFVKCDDETNPAEQIDAGMVVCEIGIAPVKPAEFVIFRLSQFSGGASTTE